MDIPPPPDGFQIDSGPQTLTLGTPHQKIDSGYTPAPGGAEAPIPGGPADPHRPGGELDPNNPKNEKLTPEALDDTTSKLILTGQMDPMGMGGGPVRLQILNNRPVMLKKYGLTDQQLPSVQSQFKSDSTAYGQRVQQLSYIQQATDAANAHMHQIAGYLSGLPGQSNIRAGNAISNFAQRQVSGETITNLDATIPLLESEVARIMTGNPSSGAGNLTDEARREFDILRSNVAPERKIEALSAISQMGQGKINGVRSEIDTLHQRMSGGLATYAKMTQQQAAAPPPLVGPGGASPPPSDGGPNDSSPTDPSLQNVGGFNDELTNNPHGAVEFHDALFNAAHAGQIKSVEDAQKWAAGFNKANGTDYGVADSPLTRKAIANAAAGKPFTVDLPQMGQTEAARMDSRISGNKADPQGSAVAAGALDSMSVGAFKPISAFADAAGDALTGKPYDYQGNLNADTAYLDNVRQSAPGSYLAGQLGGALTLPAFGARTLPELSKLGAGYGAAYGFNSTAEQPLASRGVNALSGAVEGAAVPIVLHGAGSVAGAATRGVNALRGVMPEATRDFAINPDQLAQAGQQEGVTVNRAMVNPNLDSKITAVGKTMIGSRKMQSGMRDIGNQIQDRTQALSDGNVLEPQSAGETVAGAGLRYITQTGQQFNRLYGSLNKATAGVKIPAAQAQLQTEELIKQLSEMPNQNANEIAYLQGLKQDLSKPLTIDAMRGLRTKIRQDLASGNLTFGPNEARVQSIADAAASDISNGLNAAGKSNVANRFQQVDAAYRDRMQMIQGTIQKLTGKRGQNLSGEQVYANLKAMAGPRGNASGLTRMFEQMTPEERRDMAATFADALGKNQAGDFSTAFLAKRVDAMPQAMRTAVFGPEGASSLSNLALLAKAHARVAGKLGGSPTGLANDYRGWLTDLMLGGGAGLLTHSEAKGAVIAGAAAGVKATRDVMNAKMLLNPDIQKWLSSAPATSSQRAIDVHFNRLNSIAARNPAIAQDIASLKQAIMRAANDNLTHGAAASQADAQQQNQTSP